MPFLRQHIKLLSLCTALLTSTILTSAAAENLKRAPDFSLPEIYTDNEVKLKDYLGSVVLVDFWASWCGPCRASLPEYNLMRNRLQAKLGHSKFEVLAINVDATKQDALTFLKKLDLNFPILIETSGKSQREYELMAMPTSFLVGPNGNIRIAKVGFSPGYLQSLEKEIIQIIEGD